jgi:hypothetical protein
MEVLGTTWILRAAAPYRILLSTIAIAAVTVCDTGPAVGAPAYGLGAVRAMPSARPSAVNPLFPRNLNGGRPTSRDMGKARGNDAPACPDMTLTTGNSAPACPGMTQTTGNSAPSTHGQRIQALPAR